MNKFRRFLGRISAKTCLKIDYFGSPLPNVDLGFDSRSPFRFNDYRMGKTLLNISDYIFYPSCPKNALSPLHSITHKKT